MRRLYHSLTLQVLLGVVLGSLLGITLPHMARHLFILSTLFINMIKMLIGPIVFCTIVTGISGKKDLKAAGSIGLRAFIYFEVISTIAIMLGFLITSIVKPGIGIDVSQVDKSMVTDLISQSQQFSMTEHFVNIVPTSFVDAFAKGDLLQILFFSILFGASMALLGDKVQVIKTTIVQFNDIMFKILHLILRLAPIAAFGAMSYTVGQFGMHSLVNLLELLATVYLTMLIFIFCVLGSVAMISGFSLFNLLYAIKEELLITLGTSSSEAVLPQLMERLEKYGCNKEIVGLVIPTGYSFNLDGTCIYLSAAIIFIAQAYGIQLSFYQELMLFITLLLTSKGAAGVSGSGFIVLAATLSATGFLPVTGLALIIGIDRFMSEARSITNVIGNSVATVAISRWEQRRLGKVRAVHVAK